MFHQYSWNSEVETTWISLIGWPYRMFSVIHTYQLFINWCKIWFHNLIIFDGAGQTLLVIWLPSLHKFGNQEFIKTDIVTCKNFFFRMFCTGYICQIFYTLEYWLTSCGFFIVLVAFLLIKDGLLSESFSIWLKSSKNYLEHYPPKKKMLRIVFGPLFGRFEPKWKTLWD